MPREQPTIYAMYASCLKTSAFGLVLSRACSCSGALPLACVASAIAFVYTYYAYCEIVGTFTNKTLLGMVVMVAIVHVITTDQGSDRPVGYTCGR